ncbi:unnamed protein product [Owenia fusiformis]|uniref:AP-5 complex subunit zeta-1 C-terminal TPR domain-containing protein n=1 Tax=Owenia fusiformis TaxID=6347 RepID=A0A8S4QBT3_OWEFU|nr:unnamed protein product [Owenia fusiformis]
MLKEFHQHPRVTVCCQVIPILLRVYFDTVLECGETSLLSELVPVLIERAGLLYGTTLYHQDVRRIFVEGLLNIFKAHPNILIDQQADILEFISTLRNASDKEDFFIHILWVIGEYLSPMYDTRCLPEVISSFYSALECIAYELSSSLPTQYSTMPHSCRLVTVMITAMSKLASRSQDLIPRVLLCLTKLEQQVCLHVPADHASVLHARTTELVNLLKVPNVASALLSPDADIDSGKLHKDSMSTPVLLHFIHDVLNSQQL